ncbi:hypothetical protein HY988_06870 [Candidatus Micrarchaeota archaeon]|nr:hypothetical protein [Candidatus Micrarchaeota archaeon]
MIGIKNIALVLMLLFLPLLFAQCSGSITHYVPAVVGDNGGLVNATLILSPTSSGSAQTFVSIYPRVGLATQDSIETALNYAYSKAGIKRDCDILITFKTVPDTSFIDGPSAGTAISVMSYALLENKTLRNDAIITGTVDQNGNVGPVGGLYEKAKKSAQSGNKYFITPIENFYELLMLNQLEKDFGIKILQAQKVDEVIGFMTAGVPIPDHSLSAKNRPIPELLPYSKSFDNQSIISKFSPVSKDMIDLEASVISSIPDNPGQDSVIRSYFQNEVKRQSAILNKGYVFSSANEAFMNYIDLSTVSVILSGNGDPSKKKSDIQNCLSSIKRPGLTDRNFEWVVGSDLRSIWAEQKMSQINLSNNPIMDEKYAQFNELMFADAWCHVAKSISFRAPGGGNPIDEASWKPIASTYLSKARPLASSDDTRNKLQSAQVSFDRGLYGAAIYDSQYVISMENSSARWSTLAASEREKEIKSLLDQNLTSLWGSVYQSQGAFLYSQNDSASAYRLLSFAKNLDLANSEMASLAGAAPFEGTFVQPTPGGSSPADNYLIILILIAAAIIFLLIVLLIVRLISNDNKRPSPRRYTRTKK